MNATFFFFLSFLSVRNLARILLIVHATGTFSLPCGSGQFTKRHQSDGQFNGNLEVGNMKKGLSKAASASALLMLLATAPAQAVVVFGDGGNQLQGELDLITINPVNSSIDVNADQLSPDAYWVAGGSGGSVTTVVVETGAFAPDLLFGIYDAANSANRVQLFGGAATTASRVVFSLLSDGSVEIGFLDTGVNFAGNLFGFYLDSSMRGGGGLFFSDTSLNADRVDHMAAYQGVGDTIQIGNLAAGPWTANEFILAWEDLDCIAGCDKNYTDFVVLVESIKPAPEPGSLALLGLGLLGLGAATRRKVA